MLLYLHRYDFKRKVYSELRELFLFISSLFLNSLTLNVHQSLLGYNINRRNRRHIRHQKHIFSYILSLN